MGIEKELSQSKQFLKDIKRQKKRGKDISKLKTVVSLLYQDKKLPYKHKDHPLHGNWLSYRDCHVEPDWVLIYKISPTILHLERTGSHADLFS
jgi:mRNA interferase YafQ